MSYKFSVNGLPSNSLAFTNCIYCNQADYDNIALNSGKTDDTNGILVTVEEFVYTLRPIDGIKQGDLGFNMLQRMCVGLAMGKEIEVHVYDEAEATIAGSLTFEIDLMKKNTSGKPIDIDCDKLTKVFKELFLKQVFAVDQLLAVVLENVGMRITCTGVDIASLDKPTSPAPRDFGRTKGQLIQATSITFKKKKDVAIRLQGGSTGQNTRLFERGFNFQQMGIGGLDKEFADIFRRAFASRVFPPEVIKKMGIKHVRGMLLYGAPGCGKTLIARQIGKALNAHEPKIVNGPEILNKYVGESEANIRALFEDAVKEQEEMGDNSELHIIIFDEIDAICKARGSSGDGTGVQDSIVNQLLSKIDGVDALNNVLIIGMTNRKDMIDSALLRPGRLEVHIEIGLPDEEGRVQILKIHTATMRNNNYLSEDVDIGELAERTKNFTGAELEGLVKSATSFALEREVDINNLTKTLDTDNMKVTKADFERALQEVTPAFGLEKDELQLLYRNGIIEFSQEWKDMYEKLTSMINQVRTSDKTPLLTVCLNGCAGSGKTALAAYMAVKSEYPFVKIISPDSLLGCSDATKASKISAIFTDAYRSPLSMIILDDLERLIEYVHLGPRFSNAVLQALLVLIKKPPPTYGRKLMVVATTSMADKMEELGLTDPFNVLLDIPVCDKADDLQRILEKMGDIEEDTIRQIVQRITEPIPVKQLLLIVEMARTETNNHITAESFIECYQSMKHM
ncbi:hypothetical protein WA158_008398 [Blastocystis sp. Blastoise]